MRKCLLFGLASGFALSTILVADVFAIEDGAKLLDSRCSVCHSSERPKSKRRRMFRVGVHTGFYRKIGRSRRTEGYQCRHQAITHSL